MLQSPMLLPSFSATEWPFNFNEFIVTESGFTARGHRLGLELPLGGTKRCRCPAKLRGQQASAGQHFSVFRVSIVIHPRL